MEVYRYNTVHTTKMHTHDNDNWTHLGRDKMDAISKTTFSSAFSWMKMFEFRLKFHWMFVPKGPINNIPALVQIMAWRRVGNKPLSEPMLVSLPTHICVTRPQWVKQNVRPCAYKDSATSPLCISCWVSIVSIFKVHDDVIKWKYFRVSGPLCGEFTGDTKAIDAGLWGFLWSAPN